MMVTCTDLIVADQSRSAQGRVHFINAVAAAVLPIEDVPLRARVLGQVDPAFEQVQLFASVRVYAYSLSRGRTVGNRK
jgi:hypothetical protein